MVRWPFNPGGARDLQFWYLRATRANASNQKGTLSKRRKEIARKVEISGLKPTRDVQTRSKAGAGQQTETEVVEQRSEQSCESLD